MAWIYNYVTLPGNDYRGSFDEPKTVCSYFWTLVFGIFLVFPAVFTASIMLWPFYLIYQGILKAVNKIYFRRVSKKKKKTNLFLSFLKAKKNKVCPLIEYKD